MRILLINVPHPAIGSCIPREQLPHYGLLCVGGPVIDDGHDVSLLDGEFGPSRAVGIGLARQEVSLKCSPSDIA